MNVLVQKHLGDKSEQRLQLTVWRLPVSLAPYKIDVEMENIKRQKYLEMVCAFSDWKLRQSAKREVLFSETVKRLFVTSCDSTSVSADIKHVTAPESANFHRRYTFPVKEVTPWMFNPFFDFIHQSWSYILVFLTKKNTKVSYVVSKICNVK